MNVRGEVEQIKLRLELTGRDRDSLLLELFNSFHAQAMGKCNRTEGQETPALLSAVRDAVCSAYRRRGDEGATSASVGGQSFAYADIEEKMFRELLRANQRLVRL